MTNLQPAIDYFGSQAKLAKAMNLDPMAVTQWKRRGLPVKRAIEISRLTNGAIHPGDLLPDFFIIPAGVGKDAGKEVQVPINKRQVDRRVTERRGQKQPDTEC